MENIFDYLYNKAKMEHFDFVAELRKLPVEEVIKKSNEKALKDEILRQLERSEEFLSEEQAESLFNAPKPLDALYKECIKNNAGLEKHVQAMIDDYSEALFYLRQNQDKSEKGSIDTGLISQIELPKPEYKYTIVPKRGDPDPGYLGFLQINFAKDGQLKVETYSGDDKPFSEDFFNDIQNTLKWLKRDGNILHDRKTMSLYAPDEFFKGRFRVDSQKYSYIISCTPKNDTVNAVVICYDKERLNRHIQKSVIEHKKPIRFIDSSYNDKFYIFDGDSINVHYSDGSTAIKKCEYIDETHTRIGGRTFHICEFAESMERNGHKYTPYISDSTTPKFTYYVAEYGEFHEMGEYKTFDELKAAVNQWIDYSRTGIPELGVIYHNPNSEYDGFECPLSYGLSSAQYSPVYQAEKKEINGIIHSIEKLMGYDIGMSYSGNGLSVYNRMEEVQGDYKTVAHISPDRYVDFYDEYMPKYVKNNIQFVADTSEMTISNTQDQPVFHVPPKFETWDKHIERRMNEMADRDVDNNSDEPERHPKR